jgi:hypothetical protein
VIVASLVTFIGCTKEDSGSDSTPSRSSQGSSTASEPTLRTSCGTIFKGELINPPNRKDASRGSLTYIGPNLILMKMKKREQLIKLHGIDVPALSSQRVVAQELVSSLSLKGDGYFFAAEPDCSIPLEDGTQGIVGHLFSADGKSFAEELIKKNAAVVTTDVCQGFKVSPCYRALAEQSVPPTPTIEIPEYEGPSTPAGFILWKPVSDSDGRLAVHSVPYGTSVRVEGETGRNKGGGNGYGSLARFRKAGCSYGKNVKLELILSGGEKHTFKDKTFATIPDGCRRWLISSNGTAKADNK